MVAGVLEKKGGGDKKEMGGACAQDEPIRARARANSNVVENLFERCLRARTAAKNINVSNISRIMCEHVSDVKRAGRCWHGMLRHMYAVAREGSTMHKSTRASKEMRSV